MDLKALENYPNPVLLLSTLCRQYGVNAGQDIAQLARAQSGARIYTPTHELLKDRDVILINAIDPKVDHTIDNEFFEDTVDSSNLSNDPPSEGKSDHWLVHRDNTSQNAPIQFTFESVERVTDVDAHMIFVPTHMLDFPLKLRRWQMGDVFYPFGGPGKKKISKFFKDERLSLVRKNKIWLLECAGRIMWVVGLRADERFRVTDSSKGITKISWISQES